MRLEDILAGNSNQTYDLSFRNDVYFASLRSPRQTGFWVGYLPGFWPGMVISRQSSWVFGLNPSSNKSSDRQLEKYCKTFSLFCMVFSRQRLKIKDLIKGGQYFFEFFFTKGWLPYSLIPTFNCWLASSPGCFSLVDGKGMLSDGIALVQLLKYRWNPIRSVTWKSCSMKSQITFSLSRIFGEQKTLQELRMLSTCLVLFSFGKFRNCPS